MPSIKDYGQSPRDEESYRDEWRLYYAKRRRQVVRMGFFAAGASAFILFFALLQGPIQEQHPRFTNIVADLGGVFMLALIVQWFIFNWTIGGWKCPRCGKRFFRSTFVNNFPLGVRCRHCKLRRLKKSETGPISLTQT